MAEYNIYLSEPLRRIGEYADTVSSDGTVTRRIKKLVLTGTENWQQHPNRTGLFRIDITGYKKDRDTVTCMCTHYTAAPNVGGFMEVPDNTTTFYSGSSSGSNVYYIQDSDFSDAESFKSYLAAQYANGTPVTVWYVLANATTSTFTAPTLTTAKGSNTLSVDTTLQPSSVSITVPNIYPAITKIPITGTNKEVKHVLDSSGNFVYKSPQYYTWEGIRKIVRAGLGPQYYPIGYIFYDTFNPETGTAFQVVAHNKHFDPNLTALGYTYSMTLCEVLLTDVVTFDAIEAFLYVTTAIPAGTYKFTIPNYDSTYGGNKTYYFTSTAELPANSQIVMNWPYNQTPKTVTGYAPTASLTAMGNTTAATGWNALTLTEWIDGTSPVATDLGTIAGPTTQAGTSNYGDMNHIHRARYGSNNYYESGIRQYMNATGAANTWWHPSNKFDRPYGSRSSAGKLNKLNQDFVNVLAYPTIKSKANTYFETAAEDGTTFTLGQDYTITTDKMFLLSPVEVGFSTTDTSIGTLLDYYVDATNDTRIKKRKSNNTASYWWLRTPYPSYAGSVRIVSTSGALSGSRASNSFGLAAACTIQ